MEVSSNIGGHGLSAVSMQATTPDWRTVQAPDALTLWLDELEAASRTAGTIAEYRRTVLKFLACVNGSDPPSSLHVRDFLDSIRSHNTRVCALVTLRQWYKFQIGRGLAREDPTRGIPIAKLRRRQYAMLSEADAATLLAALKHDRLMQVLTTLLYYTGTRLSEATHARVEDISFDDTGYGTIDFPHRKGGDEGFAAFGPAVTAIVRPWLVGRSGWVFPHPRNPQRPVSKMIVEWRLGKAGETAGLPGRVTPHRLRHVFATRAVERGWNQLALQKQLGHRNPMSTAWYYRATRAGLIAAYRKSAG